MRRVVVIGDRDEVEAGRAGRVGERRRRQRAVAVLGVKVKGAAVPAWSRRVRSDLPCRCLLQAGCFWTRRRGIFTRLVILI